MAVKEVMVCIAKDEDDNFASVGGIIDPDDDCCRDIEAQEACELGIEWSDTPERGDSQDMTNYSESLTEDWDEEDQPIPLKHRECGWVAEEYAHFLRAGKNTYSQDEDMDA